MVILKFELIDMKIKKSIIPAIIARSQSELEENIMKVKDFVDTVQIDVMDGKFVSNNSLDFDFELPEAGILYEAHLMIENPEEWIEKNFMKVDTLLVHFESCDKPKRIINLVRNKDKRIGFVLNPETSIDKIMDFINELDQVLIMTVNPGFYGSPFLSKMVGKISEIRGLFPDLDIEVDGGITDKTIKLVNEAGANMFVSGSYIIKSDDIENAVCSLKKIISE
jgi:ribulose-phosphate 3-epimerase